MVGRLIEHDPPTVDQARRLAEWIEVSFQGYDCVGCPLGTLAQPLDEVDNDVSEAYYECEVYGRVWGEYAQCESERDGWFRRALIATTS